MECIYSSVREISVRKTESGERQCVPRNDCDVRARNGWRRLHRFLVYVRRFGHGSESGNPDPFIELSVHFQSFQIGFKQHARQKNFTPSRLGISDDLTVGHAERRRERKAQGGIKRTATSQQIVLRCWVLFTRQNRPVASYSFNLFNLLLLVAASTSRR